MSMGSKTVLAATFGEALEFYDFTAYDIFAVYVAYAKAAPQKGVLSHSSTDLGILRAMRFARKGTVLPHPYRFCRCDTGSPIGDVNRDRGSTAIIRLSLQMLCEARTDARDARSSDIAPTWPTTLGLICCKHDADDRPCDRTRSDRDQLPIEWHRGY
jgi:hypothetical protein